MLRGDWEQRYYKKRTLLRGQMPLFGNASSQWSTMGQCPPPPSSLLVSQLNNHGRFVFLWPVKGFTQRGSIYDFRVMVQRWVLYLNLMFIVYEILRSSLLFFVRKIGPRHEVAITTTPSFPRTSLPVAPVLPNTTNGHTCTRRWLRG